MSTTSRPIGIGLPLLAVCWTIGACTVLSKGVADLDTGIEGLGMGSWYGSEFHGRVTASGEVYDMEGLTGAHRTLPLGTEVKVMNTKTGTQVRVRINDRGPYVKGRIIDVSYAAARTLQMVKDGIIPVWVQVVASSAPEIFHAGERSILAALAQPGMRPERADPRTVRTRQEQFPPHTISLVLRRRAGAHRTGWGPTPDHESA